MDEDVRRAAAIVREHRARQDHERTGWIGPAGLAWWGANSNDPGGPQ